MNNTLLSTINVMNFNNINSLRSTARKAYSPSTDFIFNNFPVSRSFGDFIDTRAEQTVEDFMKRYKESSTELSQASTDLKQLFLKTYENKKIHIDSESLEAVSKQNVMIKKYDFVVAQLATIQQDTSNAIDSNSTNLTEFGTTELELQQDGQNFTLSINTEDAENNQDVLKKISSAINKSTAAVSAKVLSDGEGNARLSLESQQTGSEKAFKLTGDITSIIGITSISSARNALYSVNGEAAESTSNTIELDNGQLEVTFKEEIDHIETISIELNTDQITSQLADLTNQLERTKNFFSDYSDDSRMLSKYKLRLESLVTQFQNDLNSVGVETVDNGSIHFSKKKFETNFENEGTAIIKNLDKANGFIDKLNKFSEDLYTQDIQSLMPANTPNNLPTFMQDDFISYLSMSRGFNINAFYPTGGILDFML